MKTNLITKNVIQRFKEGQKIQKFQKAGKFAYHGIPVQYVQNSKEKNNPLYYYIKKSDLDKIDKFGNYIGSDGVIYSGSGNGNTVYYVNNSKQKITSPQIQKRYKGRDGKWYETYKKGNDQLYRQSGTNDKFQVMSKNYYTPGGYNFYQGKNIIKNEEINPKTPPNTPSDTSNRNSNRYISTLGDIEAYKNSLVTEGLTDRDAVKAFQQKLIDAGFDVGKDGADGIWGKNTEAAYQAMLAKNREVTPTLTQQPIQQYVPSTNTLGYRTDFDYTGSNSNIRDLGFNDYSGMVNFINNNPNNQFSRDMTQRFGNTNTWNQNKVESALNVSGKYRPGRGGDFSDIMKSQAAWAGTENGTYDRNQNFWNNLKVVNGRLLFKQGGLISKNPIERFKMKIK